MQEESATIWVRVNEDRIMTESVTYIYERNGQVRIVRGG